MKIIQLAIILFLYQNLFAQKDKFATEIRQILDTQTACWNQNDLACFMSYYEQSDSLKFVSANGVSYGWNNLMQRYQKNYPTQKEKGTLRFDIFEIEKLGKYHGSVTGRFHLSRPEKGDSEGYFTLLFKKINNKWLIVMDHTSG